ncbi:N-acetylmuramoyl-L-alanine amidase [Natranaerobius thermophilus]|uniref:N-acetylmuramoyl-L-alanine amidase n=1 Tax=Natranaerobius thermophilus (strain ATCC BAA-1301 / DSM 18059 / JW/NM-WN-LF) TaxID=457570 RepID=B2A8A4_NATTJ|nr:N-acetylmuramoyl-L-alanine amidase [Natranaerobius thermophilus]ACB84470.1 N-acetylmuramoyl-L-alanine amidase [Natranaerobius thermophilus JW/NM-WN-LF]
MKGLKLTISLLVFVLLLAASGPIMGNEVSAEELEEAEVVVETLNVRSGPGLSNSLIDQVHQGETYDVLDKQTNESESYYQDWVKIDFSGYEEAWVSQDYVNITTPEAIDPEPENNSYRPLEGTRIVLDPGHGGWDPGAVGPTGLTEKEVALDVSFKTQDKLESLGAEVYLTRESDIDIPLANRAYFANDLWADLFISIHANGAINRGAQGTETHYSSWRNPNDYFLAESLQDSMIDNINRVDRGIIDSNFAVLTHARMPAALVELAFISNYEEERLLGSDYFQENAAQGITEGIVDYFNY